MVVDRLPADLSELLLTGVGHVRKISAMRDFSSTDNKLGLTLEPIQGFILEAEKGDSLDPSTAGQTVRLG